MFLLREIEQYIETHTFENTANLYFIFDAANDIRCILNIPYVPYKTLTKMAIK